MRALKIESGNIYIDGQIADLSKLESKEKEEFLSSLLTLDIELGDNVTCADIVHFFYDAKGIIKNILSEEYEVVRALISGAPLSREYNAIRVYKSFKIESEILEDNQEFIYMQPEIELVAAAPGEEGVRNVAGLRIIIDENIKLTHGEIVIESKTKISFLDLLTCIFDELPALIKDGVSLA